MKRVLHLASRLAHPADHRRDRLKRHPIVLHETRAAREWPPVREARALGSRPACRWPKPECSWAGTLAACNSLATIRPPTVKPLSVWPSGLNVSARWSVWKTAQLHRASWLTSPAWTGSLAARRTWPPKCSATSPSVASPCASPSPTRSAPPGQWRDLGNAECKGNAERKRNAECRIPK